MSDDLSLPIQDAVIAALIGDAGVSALVGSRVYDGTPPDAAFPYICLTGWQHVPEDLDCYDISEYFFDVQCFSRRVGRVEIGGIAKAVRKALAHREVMLTGGDTADLSHRDTNYFTEPDGLTHRAILNFIVTSDQF